ncbi:hypothetical protein H6P81_013788 [Aristolochia fimbriata]|uniref:Uncharacterized protein n=1 Tax=Aristolochia fimbriata TaxID=158543 RepID=A0AAV7EFP6_ARIFI|nr:hypothetical protein H6P81_013788 [Aristolochia fimbriata]
MLRRKLPLPLSRSTSSNHLHFSTSGVTTKSKSWGRKVVKIVLISVTGGFALSALDDLAIFHGCSSKGIEKVSQDQRIVEAIGEPILRGPWYNASLAVAHKRHSVSCTFPVFGPRGSGIVQLKAVRQDNPWFSFLRPQEWEILIMDATLHVPENKESQSFRVSLSDMPVPPTAECKDCRFPQPPTMDKKD